MAYDGSIVIDTKLDETGLKTGISKVNKDVKKNLDGLANFGATSIKVVGTAIAAVGAAIGGVGIKFNSDIENYTASFETLIGNTERAGKLLNDLKTMGAKTPFELGDLAKGSKTLLAFGVSVDSIIPTLNMLGDASMGNAQTLETLTMAFGKVQTKGKLKGEELMQMREVGFDPMAEISKRTGESMEELAKRIEKGGIKSWELTKALEAATGEGGRFYGSMDKASKTMSGQWSTVMDNFKSVAGSIM